MTEDWCSSGGGGDAVVEPPREQPFNDPKCPKILTFYPTMEEFKNFEKYVDFMESRNAHLGGIAKVVPPCGWKARKDGYADLNSRVIEAPISQSVRQTSNRGAYDVRNTEQGSLTVGQLRRFAEENNMVYSFAEEMEEIERNFWKQLTINPPIYGADSCGTLFDEDVNVWNVSNLPSVLRTINEEYGIAIQGVNTPYLYFGMWRAFFGWHTEDMDLYSINYIHDGAAKYWYALAPQNGRRFERLAASLFPESSKICGAFLRHKSSMISHSVLKSSGIPFNKIMQMENEFIITFPHAYHAGFNCGLNVAESTNFATERWIDYGKYASICACQEDNVKIDMGIFIKKYRPSENSAWCDGTERGKHPEDERPGKRLPTSGPAFAMSKKPSKRRDGNSHVTGVVKHAAPSKTLSVPISPERNNGRMVNAGIPGPGEAVSKGAHKRPFSDASDSVVTSTVPVFGKRSCAGTVHPAPSRRLDSLLIRHPIPPSCEPFSQPQKMLFRESHSPPANIPPDSAFCETISERICRGRRRRTPDVFPASPRASNAKTKSHQSTTTTTTNCPPPTRPLPPPTIPQTAPSCTASVEEPIDLRCPKVKAAPTTPESLASRNCLDVRKIEMAASVTGSSKSICSRLKNEYSDNPSVDRPISGHVA